MEKKKNQVGEGREIEKKGGRVERREKREGVEKKEKSGREKWNERGYIYEFI